MKKMEPTLDVVVLWLLNDGGNFLLARRSFQKAQDPGVWGTAVAGKLNPGESFVDALARETEEELSLKKGEYTTHFVFEKLFPHPDGILRRFRIYAGKLPKQNVSHIHIDPVEVADCGWFSAKEIIELLRTKPEQLVPSAPTLWPEILEAIEKLQVAGEL